MKTAEDIRRALEARYADSEDDTATVHPMIAIAVVLVSAVLTDTTDVDRLVEFTRYSKDFVGAIAANMRTEVWKDGKYRARWPLGGNRLPDDEATQIWDDIENAACTQAEGLLVRLTENFIYGSRYEINSKNDFEIPGFVATRCELFQLAKYYGSQSVEIAFDEFIGAVPGSMEWKIETFSNCRLGQIAALLGRENVELAYAQGGEEFRKSRSIEDDSRAWKLFKYGTRKERTAYHKEIHGKEDWLGILLDMEDDEKSKE